MEKQDDSKGSGSQETRQDDMPYHISSHLGGRQQYVLPPVRSAETLVRGVF